MRAFESRPEPPLTASPFLPEIPESQATGSVAEVYEDIRALTGLPLVNLVYRYLGAEPGRLEAAWNELRPNLVEPRTIEAAEAIAAASRSDEGSLSPGTVEAPALDAAELARARATLTAYERGNSRNLIAVSALLSGAPGTSRTSADVSPAAESLGAEDILPIVALEDLGGPRRQLLDEMAGALTAPGETVLIPGLLRHFAHNPELLGFFWTILEPRVADGTITARAGRLDALARQAVGDLPALVTAIDDPDVRVVLTRFALTIPRMMVVGGILQTSLVRSA